MKILFMFFAVLFLSGCQLEKSQLSPVSSTVPATSTSSSPVPLSAEQQRLAQMTTIPTPSVSPSPKTSTCAQDVIICPNSSVINREGKDCIFEACSFSPVSNMATYRNPSLGFELSFPPSFRAVTDKYGWPKEVVLLYKGGQSYDLAIESFANQAEIDKKYIPPQPNLTVKKAGGKMITFLNMNDDPEVDTIIQSFKLIY